MVLILFAEEGVSMLLLLREKDALSIKSGIISGDENGVKGPNFGLIELIGPNFGANGPNILRLYIPLLSIIFPLPSCNISRLLNNAFALSMLSKDDPLAPYGIIGLISAMLYATGPKLPNILLNISVFLEINVFGSTNFGMNGDFGI